MSAHRESWSVVSGAAQLEELVGVPIQRVADKSRSTLHELDRQWLAAAPMCVIATAAADGSCDASPRGDPPGFTHVLDERTIAIPDRPGNRRVDGFRNVLENPHVGHCSKAFLRASLWDPASWSPDAAPSRAQIAKALERPEDTIAEDYYGPKYAERLYR